MIRGSECTDMVCTFSKYRSLCLLIFERLSVLPSAIWKSVYAITLISLMSSQLLNWENCIALLQISSIRSQNRVGSFLLQTDSLIHYLSYHQYTLWFSSIEPCLVSSWRVVNTKRLRWLDIAYEVSLLCVISPFGIQLEFWSIYISPTHLYLSGPFTTY